MTFASAEAGLRHVFIRDLELEARVGVSESERAQPQPLRISIDLAVVDARHGDEVARVVDYALVAERVRELVAGPPVRLVETLAERLAEACLEDARVRRARVTVEKPRAVAGAQGVGVAVERRNPRPPPTGLD